MQIDRALAVVGDGKLAERTLTDIAPFLEHQGAAINERVYSVLRRGETLSVDLAVQAWYDKWALVQLQNSLVKAVKQGHNASARVGNVTMEGKNG